MKRRSLLLLGALSPIALFTRYLGARAARAPLPIDSRQRAEELNGLASTIQSPGDARRLVDFLTELFSKETPTAWLNSSLQGRIAQAEFSAVSNPQKSISEPHLAEAWNAYVGTMRVPDDWKVTPAEIHNLRDAFLTTARLSWDRGSRNIWAVPSIYATLSDGRLAPGCRAVESIRVLWDLANMPDNLRAARDRESKGVLASELYRRPPQSAGSPVTRARVTATVRNPTSMELAERDYIKLNGNQGFNKAVMAMLNAFVVMYLHEPVEHNSIDTTRL